MAVGERTIGHRGGGGVGMLCVGRTGMHAAVEQGRARLAAGGASVKETRSYAACLLRLSRRARW
jgi:hypothetical protein